MLPVLPSQPISRTQLNHLSSFVVTIYHVYTCQDEIIALINALPGPKVVFDPERNCYGLQAERAYKKGQTVTRYGGERLVDRHNDYFGDYVAACGSSRILIDGHHGFKLSEKGRWINEYDVKRLVVNVEITRIGVHALCDIEQGEWFFADYGEEYQRTY